MADPHRSIHIFDMQSLHYQRLRIDRSALPRRVERAHE